MKDKEGNKRTVAIAVTMLGMISLIVGGVFLGVGISHKYGDTIVSNHPQPSSTSTVQNNVRYWGSEMVLNLPTDTVGGTKDFDVRYEVPCFDGIFEEDNILYVYNEQTPYVYEIRSKTSNGDNYLKYKKNLEKYYFGRHNKHEPQLFTFSVTDYFYDTLEDTYVTQYNDHLLAITVFYNDVENIFIRYIPLNIEFFGLCEYYFGYSILPLLPNLECNAIAKLKFEDNTLFLAHDATEDELVFYEQTLTYFKFEKVGDFYIHQSMNDLIVDISHPNQLLITAV